MVQWNCLLLSRSQSWPTGRKGSQNRCEHTLVWPFRTGFSLKYQTEAASNPNGNAHEWHMWHTYICKGHAPGEELCTEVRAQAKGKTTGSKLIVTVSAFLLMGEKILSQYHFEQVKSNFPWKLVVKIPFSPLSPLMSSLCSYFYDPVVLRCAALAQQRRS